MRNDPRTQGCQKNRRTDRGRRRWQLVDVVRLVTQTSRIRFAGGSQALTHSHTPPLRICLFFKGFRVRRSLSTLESERLTSPRPGESYSHSADIILASFSFREYPSYDSRICSRLNPPPVRPARGHHARPHLLRLPPFARSPRPPQLREGRHSRVPRGCRSRTCCAAQDTPARPRNVNSVIILWMRGGPSHIDMWDPKPDAPAEYRGEFGTIATNVPGIRLSRHAADVGADHGQVVDHPQPAPPRRRPLHRRPDLLHRLQRRPEPGREHPPVGGSIVSKQLGHLNPTLPAYVMIPRMLPGTGSAYLGVAHKPFETQADPAQPGPVQLPNFQLASRRDAGTGRRPQGAARRTSTRCAATRTTPASWTRSTASSSRRGTSSRRPPPATPSTSTASRRSSASATASCPRSTRRPRTAAAHRPGPAHAAGPPAGRGRRAAGHGRSALVGHAREGLRVAARSASCRAGTGRTRR